MKFHPPLPGFLFPRGLARWLPLVLAAAGCALSVHPAQRLSRYPDFQQRQLAARIRPADPAVIDRTHDTNLTFGKDIRPRPLPADDPMTGLLSEVVFRLPKAVKRLAEPHLVALFLLRDDYGTAVTEGVTAGKERWEHGYIALNATALEKNANAWASWKENSAFRPAKGYGLKMRIESKRGDDRAGAIRFILLHELGHLVGLARGMHPFWEDKSPPPPRSFRFMGLSWRGGPDGKPVSRWQSRFPRLHQAGFYRFAKAPFALSEVETIYNMLSRTDLPSLYGATNPYDDFAEAFAIYVHTRLMGKPYRVELFHNGNVVRVFRSCIQSGGCAEKIVLLRSLLRAG